MHAQEDRDASRTLTESTAESLKNSILGNEEDSVHREPVVEVLWHYDLAMIGAQWYPSTASSGASVVFGRQNPEFITLEDDRWNPHAKRAPLRDPCVSRRHFELRWSQQDLVFELRALSISRLTVEVLSFDAMDDGEPLGAEWTRVEPGRLVRIGNRVLLSLDVRVAWRLVGGRRLCEIEPLRAIRAQASSVYGEDSAHFCLEIVTRYAR